MNIQFHSDRKTGFLQIVDGVKSGEKARTIKAGLGDLPGVRSVEVIGSAVRARFDSQMVTNQQFYPTFK